MFFSPKTSADGLVFHYDTGNTVRSYLGEPTVNLLPEGVAATHDAASGNAVTVTDATNEKGPGWKKVTITTRGTNFRTLQWSYITMSANITYCHSAVFDWGNMRGKNYFIYFDGNGTGTRAYYRPGDYINQGSGDINSTMPDGKFAGTITHTASHTHAFFIGNNTINTSGLNDYFYYKEFQVEVKSHPTQFTTGTRSATQGLKDLTAKSTIDISTVSFDSNAQMTFDGTDDTVTAANNSSIDVTGAEITLEAVFKPDSFGVAEAIIHKDVQYTLAFYPNGGQGNVTYADSSLWSYSTFGYHGVFLTGKYYHVVVTKKNGVVNIYSNSEIVVSTSFGGSITSTSNPLYIGSYVTSYYSHGEIPVAKIYNRALTTNEVARNYNAIKSRFNIG